MAPESVTQDRIYSAIKTDYLRGVFRPRTRIDLQAIADRHRSSTTPVREAVHRLVGERIFAPHADGGFMLAMADGARLAHFYSWYCEQLLGALHHLRDSALSRAFASFRYSTVPGEPIGQAERTDLIFQAVADETGNLELIEQIARANERLRYPRLAESLALPNVYKDIENLTRNGTLLGVPNVRRRVVAYHERRILHAGEIASTALSVGNQARTA